MSHPKAPKIDLGKLDFSQYHPLDHRIGNQRCREHYGSWRRHLWCLWHFKWDVRRHVKRITHCTFGYHNPRPHFRRDGTGNMVYGGHNCCWCFKKTPSASPEE